MKTIRWMSVILCLSVLATGVMSLFGCGAKVQAANLMDGVTAKTVSGKAADDAFKKREMAIKTALSPRCRLCWRSP